MALPAHTGHWPTLETLRCSFRIAVIRARCSIGNTYLGVCGTQQEQTPSCHCNGAISANLPTWTTYHVLQSERPRWSKPYQIACGPLTIVPKPATGSESRKPRLQDRQSLNAQPSALAVWGRA